MEVWDEGGLGQVRKVWDEASEPRVREVWGEGEDLLYGIGSIFHEEVCDGILFLVVEPGSFEHGG